MYTFIDYMNSEVSQTEQIVVTEDHRWREVHETLLEI